MEFNCEMEAFDHENDIEILYDSQGESYVKENNESLFLLEQGCCLTCYDFKQRAEKKKKKA